MPKIDKSKPIILVDTSYTSFYRFFAAIRWYSFAFAEEFKDLKTNNKYDWSKNQVFMEKYEKMYLDSIIKLVKKKVFENSNIIFDSNSTIIYGFDEEIKFGIWKLSSSTNSCTKFLIGWDNKLIEKDFLLYLLKWIFIEVKN